MKGQEVEIILQTDFF